MLIHYEVHYDHFLKRKGCCHHSTLCVSIFAANYSKTLQHGITCYRHILLKRLVCSIKVPDNERLRPTDGPNRWLLKNKTDRLQHGFHMTYMYFI